MKENENQLTPPARSTRTHYVAVYEKKQPVDFTQAAWTPWIKVSDREQLIGLVVNKHLRERGGLSPDERLNLFVFDRTTMNHPCVVNMTHLVASKGKS